MGERAKGECVCFFNYPASCLNWKFTEKKFQLKAQLGFNSLIPGEINNWSILPELFW